MSRYKPTTAKYKGRTKTLYAVYEETHMHNYRGHRKKRTQTRVKRFYVSGELVEVKGPGVFTNRFGRRVYGLKVVYENPVRATVAHRRGRRVKIPRRMVRVTKIVPLPRSAKNVRVTSRAPRGPLMDVA